MAAASEPACGSVSEKPPSALPDVSLRPQRRLTPAEPKRPIAAATALCIDSANAYAASPRPSSSNTGMPSANDSPWPPTPFGANRPSRPSPAAARAASREPAPCSPSGRRWARRSRRHGGARRRGGRRHSASRHRRAALRFRRMKPILVVENDTMLAGPGWITRVLDRRGLPHRVVDVTTGGLDGIDAGQISGLITLGGRGHAWPRTRCRGSRRSASSRSSASPATCRCSAAASAGRSWRAPSAARCASTRRASTAGSTSARSARECAIRCSRSPAPPTPCTCGTWTSSRCRRDPCISRPAS